MFRNRWVVLAASGLLLSGTVTFAQQQQPGQKQGPTGEATIVQRQATKIDCKQGARPIAAVIFTDAQQSQAQQGGDLVISISESSGQNTGSGSEALFEKKNALDGVVTHDFGAQNAGGQGTRSLLITGRRGNEVVEIQQIGTAGNNAMIYAVRKPKTAEPQPNVAQADQKKQAEDAAQQAAAKQKADQEAAAKAQAAQAQAQAQQQQQQQAKAEAAPAEENDAVIMVYMVGAAK
jgi:hypothetical protein